MKHSKDGKKPIATMSRADASRRDLFKSLKEQRINGHLSADHYAEDVARLYLTSRNKHKAYVDLDHVLVPVEVENFIHNSNLLKIFDTVGLLFQKYYISIYTIHYLFT